MPIPDEISHITQARVKWVRVPEDAPTRYSQDDRFRDILPEFRQFGIRCLEAAKGKRCIVSRANWMGNTLWYELILPEPLTVEMTTGMEKTFRLLHIAADYVTITDSGFMEAR